MEDNKKIREEMESILSYTDSNMTHHSSTLSNVCRYITISIMVSIFIIKDSDSVMLKWTLACCIITLFLDLIYYSYTTFTTYRISNDIRKKIEEPGDDNLKLDWIINRCSIPMISFWMIIITRVFLSASAIAMFSLYLYI